MQFPGVELVLLISLGPCVVLIGSGGAVSMYGANLSDRAVMVGKRLRGFFTIGAFDKEATISLELGSVAIRLSILCLLGEIDSSLG